MRMRFISAANSLFHNEQAIS